MVETGNTDFVEEEKPQKDADVENTAATDDSVNEKEEIKYILVLEFENGIILKHNSLKIDGTDLSHFYSNQGTEVSSSDFGWELTM